MARDEALIAQTVRERFEGWDSKAVGGRKIADARWLPQ
jgi:hypothetical protein